MATKRMLIETEKENGKLSLSLTIPEEVEMFFKSISEGTNAISGKWFIDSELSKGAEFYKLNGGYAAIEKKLSDKGINTYNDFGDALTRGRAINLAPLRVIGVSKGIKLYSNSFNDNGLDMEFYIRELGIAVKELWRENIGKQELKAVISYEV